MTGTEIANHETQRKRVTGGILRISSKNHLNDIARARGFGQVSYNYRGRDMWECGKDGVCEGPI